MNKYEKEVELAKLEAEAKELKHLKAIYSKAADDISKKLSISNGKINVMLNDFDELDDVQKSILQSQIYQRNFQLSLKKQIDGFMKELNSGQYESINKYLEGCYETGFLGAMYDIHGQGIPIISPIDQKQVIKAKDIDSKISKKLYTKLGEDVDVLKKRIANNISRGIATADSYSNIARNISSASNVGFNNAMRIARTEGHRIQAAAAFDAQHKAKDAGADIVKQWDSTLDGRTRDTHRMLDGQIRELDEPFEVYGHKARFPSDFGLPSEDINCRCALLQRARWALDEDELETLKERAAFYGLDKTESFQDFQNKYLKAAEAVQDDEYQKQINSKKAAYKAKQASKQPEQQITLPNFDKMSHAELVKWADSNLKTTFDGMKGANNDFVREAVKTVATFENKMGGTIDGLTVKFGGTAGNAYAQYDAATKTLMLKKTGSLKKIEERMEEANARFRAKWKVDKDYHAITTYDGLVYHELGHAVDHDMGQKLSKMLGADDALYAKAVNVSGYAGARASLGAPKASEAWAENFAAYMAGGANAKKVTDEVKEMIESYFRTKKAEKVVVNVKKPAFIPAKTIEEAEDHIKKFVDSSGFGATGISYSGISVESANAVNEALEKLYERFDMDKLGGVYVAKGNTKLGKAIDGATAAYSPIRKSLLINNKSLKNPDVFLKSRKEELEIIKKYKEDPSSYTFRTKRAEDVAKASLVSGRATVPDTVEDVINHEMGHSIEKMVAKADGYETVKANISKYADKISGYATINESEYIAESFASYLKGEGLIDPNLEKIFKGLERNG